MKYIYLIIYIIFKSSLFFSQTTFENIKSFQTENVGSFLDQQGQIKGYYLLNSLSEFYDKKAIFQLSILDTSFNKKSVVDLELMRNSGLVDVVTSGDAVMMYFVSNKGYELYTCNLNGEKLGYKFIPKNEINKFEYDYIYQNSNKELSFYYLNPNIGNTFIRVTHIKGKKYHRYRIICYDDKLNEVWSYSPLNQRKKAEDVELNYGDDKQIIFTISERNFVDAQKVQQKIICLNPVDGTVKYSIDLVDKDKGNRSVCNVFLDKENLYVTGEYYQPGKEIQYDESEGFYIYEISDKGEILMSKEVSWDKYETLLTEKEDVKKRKIDRYSLYFHDLIFLDSGKIYFVGEQYRKKLSLSGALINEAVGFYASSYYEIEFGDLLLLEFDENFFLEDVKRIEKHHHSKLMIHGKGGYSTDYLVNKYKEQGEFDLKFIDKNLNRSSFSIIYSNIKNYVSLTVDGEAIRIKEIDFQLVNNPVSNYLMNINNNQILFYEYIKRDKTLKLSLRKTI